MIIYKATNKINGKIYIGLTTQTLDFRKYKHKSDSESMRKNRVFNKAIRKYGWDSFIWEIIDTAESVKELKEKEMFWIEHFNSYVLAEKSNGYNMTRGGDGSEGLLHSEESKKKMKQNHANFKKENHPQWGMKFSEERKRKLSEIRKGKYTGEKHPFYGKKLSDSHKQNMSKTLLEKGLRKGEKNGRAILNREIVVKIHTLYNAKKFTQKELGEMFSVSKSTISAIINGKIWSDVKRELNN
jgi:group I intron endonuclease